MTNRPGPFGPGPISHGPGLAERSASFQDILLEVTHNISGLSQDPREDPMECPPAQRAQPGNQHYTPSHLQQERLGCSAHHNKTKVPDSSSQRRSAHLQIRPCQPACFLQREWAANGMFISQILQLSQ